MNNIFKGLQQVCIFVFVFNIVAIYAQTTSSCEICVKACNANPKGVDPNCIQACNKNLDCNIPVGSLIQTNIPKTLLTTTSLSDVLSRQTMRMPMFSTMNTTFPTSTQPATSTSSVPMSTSTPPISTTRPSIPTNTVVSSDGQIIKLSLTVVLISFVVVNLFF